MIPSKKNYSRSLVTPDPCLSLLLLRPLIPTHMSNLLLLLGLTEVTMVVRPSLVRPPALQAVPDD